MMRVVDREGTLVNRKRLGLVVDLESVLEDVNTVSPEDLDRLPRFSVMAETFGSDASSDATPLWSALTGAGARLLFGSDWPAGSFDPREILRFPV